MFSNLSLKARLTSAIGSLALIAIMLGIIDINTANHANEKLKINHNDALHFASTLTPLINKISIESPTLGDELKQVVRSEAAVEKMHYDDAIASIKYDKFIGITLTVFALVVGAVSLVLIKTSIIAPLEKIEDKLGTIADQNNGVAAQLSSSSQSLADGTGRQASSVQETASALEELSASTERNSSNSEEASQKANETREAAESGTNEMKEMIEAMNSIKSSSDNIANIIKTIDEIAFQTNILALNAAVEAARAGEAGAGFAVVADEVRSLAQRCASAAKDTAQQIEDSIQRSEIGVSISNRVGESFENILGKAREVNSLVAEITSATQEQSTGITHINTAINQLEADIQSNSAVAEETASTSEQLASQSNSLQNMVSNFRTLIKGGGNRQRTASSKPQSQEPSPMDNSDWNSFDTPSRQSDPTDAMFR